MSSDGVLQKITVRPGINKNDAPYQSEGFWVSADKIRFEHGNPKKIGGWQRIQTPNRFSGTPRAAISWLDLPGRKHYAVGTHDGLYVFNNSDWRDITPLRSSGQHVSIFSTQAGSTEIRVSLNNHGALKDDYVTFTPVSLGNVWIRGKYRIVSAEPSRFFFHSSVETAGSSLTALPVAASVSVGFLLRTGRNDKNAIGGWSAGEWSCSTWSNGCGGEVFSAIRQWTLDNWGELLVANVREGETYTWNPNTPETRAMPISPSAPRRSLSVIVTEPTRHLMTLGCSAIGGGSFDPLLVRWSDMEDFTDWTPAVTNASGQQRLKGGSFIQSAVQTKREILIFTDEGVHSATYQGLPFVFGFDKLAGSCGIISKHAAAEINGIVYWMGIDGFYRYDGRVSPLPSTVYSAIFDQAEPTALNPNQREKVYCGLNLEFQEVWWFYPSKSSSENDRYVVYNFETNLWYDGTMNRTTWIAKGVFNNPIATDTTQAYFHESTNDQDNLELPARLESGWFDIDEGEKMVFVNRLVPDVKNASGVIGLRVQTAKYVNAQIVEKGPYAIGPATQKINARFRGRVVKLIYTVSGMNSYAQFGDLKAELLPDGER